MTEPCQEIKFKRDTAFRKQFFVPDSFAHPAKMDAQLLIWLVERYTEIGETILDPMAGMGTTMLACGLGRNVVLNELEGKFCTMMRDNWGQVRMRPQLGYEMGTCRIIQGDARNLEGLLVDKIITSPPYAEVSHHSDNPKELEYLRPGRSARVSGTAGEREDNIGNLPYGQIDKIVTSPPYAEAKSAITDKIWLREHQDELSINSPSRYGAHQRENLHHERLIIPDNPSNIGNLTYGNIDAMITSPPYGNPRDIGEQAEKNYEDNRLGVEDKQHGRTQFRGRYEVDAVITSPPYERSATGKEGGGIKEWSTKRYTSSTSGLANAYSDNPTNIGNLKSQSYLEAMLQVYQQCHKVLKPNGLMILVTKNFIRNKQVIRLDLDTIKLCEQAGFELIERHYRKLPSQSFWRIIYAQKHPEVELIDTEDILVFRQLINGLGGSQ